MADTRFVFAVDLDGVVADFYGGLRSIAADWLGVPEADLPTEVTYGLPEWHIEEHGGYDALHRFAVTQRELFKGLTPISGAPRVLRHLSLKDVRIRIVTHRLYQVLSPSGDPADRRLARPLRRSLLGPLLYEREGGGRRRPLH